MQAGQLPGSTPWRLCSTSSMVGTATSALAHSSSGCVCKTGVEALMQRRGRGSSAVWLIGPHKTLRV